MQAFDYIAAQTLDEAVSLLAAKGDQARVLAGGTDLIVQLREGRRRLELVVDVKKIPDVNVLSYDTRNGLTLGAAVPCHRVYGDVTIARAYPGLMDAFTLVGGTQIQGRASVGGNLCNSSPAADTIPTLIAHQATCVIAGPGGRRELPVEQFCTAPGRNVLGNGEFLVALRLPAPGPRFGARYLRFIPRNEMDIAVVGVGSALTLGDDGATVTAARIALGAVAPTPLLVNEAGAALVGKPISDATIAQAAAAAQAAARPISDMRGTADQRRHLVGVLTRRTLQGAIARARGETVSHA
ncbi:MAG: xanthine dehydrogenase family protein subunit M [Candidatus Tectomicrobia bacterium]|uniref:Xanthine dehydrogenase family protein subunit M n=1 Tax=Tectimicrobiota bacterium TaxID=2528274 RepID=A0A937VWW2_UNCTE|nr:xanthine dehydrogenase family protein subunit M [Candidatus Tectomicrobia bacterium]